MPPRRERQEEKPRRVATTVEGRENQLIALAIDLTERQLIEGTASAQVISHYLKLGSSRERLEQEKLKYESKLVGAKVEALEGAQRIEELYSKAIKAMRTYGGHDEEEDDD